MNSLQKLAVRYPDKRVLITGATSGLGEALSLMFAGVGFRISVASRNSDNVAATVARVEQAGGVGLRHTFSCHMWLASCSSILLLCFTGVAVIEASP